MSPENFQAALASGAIRDWYYRTEVEEQRRAAALRRWVRHWLGGKRSSDSVEYVALLFELTCIDSVPHRQLRALMDGNRRIRNAVLRFSLLDALRSALPDTPDYFAKHDLMRKHGETSVD